jgi:hypothetical protein
MRAGSALWVGLVIGLVVGCVDGPPRQSTSWLDRFRQGAAPSGPDIVAVDVAVIECPYGNPYLNQGLWAATDEQVVEVEVKAQLEDNGFRVGEVGGMLPGELQSLLASEKSCPEKPRSIQSRAGKPSQLLIGPNLAHGEYHLQRNGETTTVALDDAQCVLETTATPMDDGRVRLKIVPIVEHGAARMAPKPMADLSGWMYAQDRSTERYPQMGWELTLAGHEFAIIGGRYDRPGTLGNLCFLRSTEQPPVQRLLLVRAHPVGIEALPPVAEATASAPRNPPLACQASRSVVRGSAP